MSILPDFEHGNIRLYLGDCLDVMPELEPVETCITDSPWGIKFMGQAWDHGVPGVPFWKALRLKPGGMLLAFGGTRTFHRLVCAIEDAGFEIRDTISFLHDGNPITHPLLWITGQGFPKSLNIGKAIDKVNGELGRLLKFTCWMRTTGLTARQIDEATSTNMGGHYLTSKSQPAIPTPHLWTKLRPLCDDVPVWVDELVERIEAEREVVGQQNMGKRGHEGVMTQETCGLTQEQIDITAPATPDAQLWDGWGTALKPAHEPICVAMRPLDGTFAQNALKWKVAGLNVGGGWVGYQGESDRLKSGRFGDYGKSKPSLFCGEQQIMHGEQNPQGRWPANVIMDDAAGALLDQMSGVISASFRRGDRGYRIGLPGEKRNADGAVNLGYHDTGGASRFFYCAKASRAERNAGLIHHLSCLACKEVHTETHIVERRGKKTILHAASKAGTNGIPSISTIKKNKKTKKYPWSIAICNRNGHPTVKTLALLEYLARLTATPTGGTIIDPFMGSGSMGVAAVRQGRGFIGIKKERKWFDIAVKRIEHAIAEREGGVVPQPKPEAKKTERSKEGQLSLF